MDFVGAIEQPESSEVVQYLKKCLNDICAKQSTTIGVQNGQNAAVPAETVQKEEVFFAFLRNRLRNLSCNIKFLGFWPLIFHNMHTDCQAKGVVINIDRLTVPTGLFLFM